MKGWIYFTHLHFSNLPCPGPRMENPQGSLGMAQISWAAKIPSLHGAIIFSTPCLSVVRISRLKLGNCSPWGITLGMMTASPAVHHKKISFPCREFFIFVFLFLVIFCFLKATKQPACDPYQRCSNRRTNSGLGPERRQMFLSMVWTPLKNTKNSSL